MSFSPYYAPGWETAVLWTVVVGFVVAFFLAFGMGANDCANSYGTVIGSGVLRLWQAYLLATVFETAGAMLLGYKVTDTIRDGIVDVSMYDVYSRYNQSADVWFTNSTPCSVVPADNCTLYSSTEFYYSNLGALTGTAVWLIAASLLRMPVSATQSTVGAMIGASMVFNGLDGINWYNDPFSSSFVAIVVSWVASPLMAGFFSTAFFLIIKFTIFTRVNQVLWCWRLMPLWFWLTITVSLITVLYDGSKFIGLDQVGFGEAVWISVLSGFIVAVFVWVIGGKWILKYAERVSIAAKNTASVMPAEPTTSFGKGEVTITNETSDTESAQDVVSVNGQTNVAFESESDDDNLPNGNVAVANGVERKVEGDESDLKAAAETAVGYAKKPQTNGVAGAAGQRRPAHGIMKKINRTSSTGDADKPAKRTGRRYVTISVDEPEKIDRIREKRDSSMMSDGPRTPASSMVDGDEPEPPRPTLTRAQSVRASMQTISSTLNRPASKSIAQSLSTVTLGVPSEDPIAVHAFDVLQVIASCVLAFSHGSNDTANAVGPLVAIFLSYLSGTADQDESDNPYMEAVIAYGVVCMLSGLYVLGHKVIATIGKDLTNISPPSGFAMTLGTAFTVLFASKLGIPVSTTHCMVGAVVFVGLASSGAGGRAVDWSLFGGIAFAWLVTVPVTAGVAALVAYLLGHFITDAV